MDRITSMRVFVRAASVGSLSAPPAPGHVAGPWRPSMSMHLKRAWAVKLFHRTTRRLSLTEAGSNYLEACQRILPEIDEAEAAATSQRIKATGLLRMKRAAVVRQPIRRSADPGVQPPASRSEDRARPQRRQLDVIAAGVGTWPSASAGWPTARCRPAAWATARCGSAPRDYLDRRGVPRRWPNWPSTTA